MNPQSFPSSHSQFLALGILLPNLVRCNTGASEFEPSRLTLALFHDYSL